MLNTELYIMKLTSNVGTADRTLRLILAIVLIVLFYTGIMPGIVGVIGLIIALLLTVTSLISFCPVYKIFRVNSIFKKDEKTDGSGVK